MIFSKGYPSLLLSEIYLYNMSAGRLSIRSLYFKICSQRECNKEHDCFPLRALGNDSIEGCVSLDNC